MLFLEFAAHSNFRVYQMDVKSAFLNGELDEEVYVEHPLVLKIQIFWTLSTSFSKLSMALNKSRENGMRCHRQNSLYKNAYK